MWKAKPILPSDVTDVIWHIYLNFHKIDTNLQKVYPENLVFSDIGFHMKIFNFLLRKFGAIQYPNLHYPNPQLSELSVIQILFWILKSFDFQQNQITNGMPVWFLDLLGLLYHSTVQWIEKHISMYSIIGHPRYTLSIMCINSIVYS